MGALRGYLAMEPLDRRPGRVIALIGVSFALFYLAAFTLFPRGHGRIIDGDSIQYYAYLRSLVIDHDVDFTNDYRLLYTPASNPKNNVWLASKTPTGHAVNFMSIGPALLWSPFFLATYAALGLLHPLGVAVPLDGMAPPFALSVGVAGIFYATLGAYLCYKACALLLPPGPALWGALVAWLATPALYYSLVSPAYSHAASLFACALFCYFWLKTLGQTATGRYVWLGLLAGLAALVRWQDVILLALPALEMTRALVGRRQRARSALPAAILMLVGAGIMFLPQLLAWRAIYGRAFIVPQGEGFMRWTRPEVLAVLFSLQHGLFSWTPAVLLAVLGLYFLVRRDVLVGTSALVVFLLTLYVNAAVSDWWAGEAFGARRFVSDTVLFALGFAALAALPACWKRPVAVRWGAVALIVYNLLFLLQYQLYMRGFRDLAPYPGTLTQVLFDRVTMPWIILRAWLGR